MRDYLPLKALVNLHKVLKSVENTIVLIGQRILLAESAANLVDCGRVSVRGTCLTRAGKCTDELVKPAKRTHLHLQISSIKLSKDQLGG